jgi:hypothetical protein
MAVKTTLFVDMVIDRNFWLKEKGHATGCR